MNDSQALHLVDEDEIDLRELFSTIWKAKFSIAIVAFLITSLTIVYALSIPNMYKAQTKLVPQTQAKPSLGGLSALAGMAGVDLGGGSMEAGTSFETILQDYVFQSYMIKKYDLINKVLLKKDNLVFAFGYDGIYKMLNDNDADVDDRTLEAQIFDTYKFLLSSISISTDKKSGLITLSAEFNDRVLAKEMVEIYLLELTKHLRNMEMQNVEKQIMYYNSELQNTVDINIQTQLGELVGGLVQKKVLAMANQYYNVQQLTKPTIAYIKDKTKPKRALIIIVSFITSIILAIFGVFFFEFIKNKETVDD